MKVSGIIYFRFNALHINIKTADRFAEQFNYHLQYQEITEERNTCHVQYQKMAEERKTKIKFQCKNMLIQQTKGSGSSTNTYGNL